MNYVKLLICGFVLSFSGAGLIAQPTHNQTLRCAGAREAGESSKCVEWKSVEVRGILIDVPGHVDLTIRPGEDQSRWEFLDKDVEMTVYVGQNAPSIGYSETRRRSFGKERRFVNNFLTVFWQYDDVGKSFPFVRAARYAVGGTESDRAVTIYLRIKDERWLENATRIFSSVRFKKSST